MSIDWDMSAKREAAYKSSEKNAKIFWDWLMDPKQVSDEEIAALGLLRIDKPRLDYKIGKFTGELRRIEVHSVRPARRVGPDGNIRSDLIVEITQSFRLSDPPGVRFRGGCTLLIDLATAEVRYMVRKRVDQSGRLETQLDLRPAAAGGLRANYFADESAPREPFAMMHRVHG
jgi:hypothetical protein